MHSAFPRLVPEQVFLPRPPAATVSKGAVVCDEMAAGSWAALVEETVARRRGELAAIIVEPVLQGAGGMYVYAPRCLRELRRVADEHGILLVLDEIATGFGRTGKLFAAGWAGIAPDVMCVGKALTGGYLTLAAVLCTNRVASVITGSEHRTLLHGPTFMANPLACAVASASLGLLDGQWPGQVSRISDALATSLASAAVLDCVREVRVIGAVGVVELNRAADIPALTRAAIERGVWLRPFRNLVYTMPPYICTPADIHVIGAAITAAIAQVHG
jgi:adenosylmethionine-8-amino-7-oxononanoate aminotransferase